METKKILGLDIGTNSIGAAVIELPSSLENFGSTGKIHWVGTRVIPTDAKDIQNFVTGTPGQTPAALRRIKRASRRLKHRYKLRRYRLVKVLKILGWVPEDFPLDDPRGIKRYLSNHEGVFDFDINKWLPLSDETIKEATEELGVEGQVNEKGNPVVPRDWFIYYLRKKALTQKITLSELCRILLMMNQRRGFKSSRKDSETTEHLSVQEFEQLKEKIKRKELKEYEEGRGKEVCTRFVTITRVKEVKEKETEVDKKGRKTYVITVEDDRIKPWEIKRFKKPEWEGKEYQFLVEQKIDKKGTIKQEKNPTTPDVDSWQLLMTALDNQIAESAKHPGAFFWDNLVSYKKRQLIYKIRQNVVKRDRYENELNDILNAQLNIRKKEGAEEELLQTSKIETIAKALYPINIQKQNELKKSNLFHILLKDIIYYQRDYKSCKHLISECRLEKRIGIQKDDDGRYIQTGIYGLKCAPKSSPLFQEFRIWQDIHNMRIIQKEQREEGRLKLNVDVTGLYINDKIKSVLFDLFDKQEEVKQEDIFNTINGHIPNCNLNEALFKINLYANRDKLKGNETKAFFRNIFKKHSWTAGESILNDEKSFYRLWHIAYSIDASDIDTTKRGIHRALKKQFPNMPDAVIESISESTSFPKAYSAFSAAALRKLLLLMRCDKYWSWEAIEQTKTQLLRGSPTQPCIVSLSDRIQHLIQNGLEKEFKTDKRALKYIGKRVFKETKDFNGLPAWLAAHIIYAKQNGSDDKIKYTPEQIRQLNVLQLVPLNSLRNPIVEKVIREAITIVRDVCNTYGQPDEIHIELARELKKNRQERKILSEINNKNQKEKQRVKILLAELIHEQFEHYNEDNEIITSTFTIKPDPNRIGDIERFRIYKSCGQFNYDKKRGENEDEIKMNELFADDKSKTVPSKEEIKKYILWLSQRCRSPYTGRIIPLSKLFDDTFYEKDHIMPRALIKNDGMDNLVIVETGVNKAKDKKLAAKFILDSNGKCSYGGKEYTLFTYEEYEKYCKATFSGKKLKNLLSTEVPEDFIERQINDTRYIGRKLAQLLGPFAKQENGIVFTIGSITAELRDNWGLDKLWKRLLEPRFRRLEKITGNTYVRPNNKHPNDIEFVVPEVEALEIKRIDHRHHALDALVIAATTREHIRYLNTLNAADTDEEFRRYQLKLCRQKIREFIPPWPQFTEEAKKSLMQLIVTFKKDSPIVSRPCNRYQKWIKHPDGTWQKQFVTQEPRKNWMAVRRSLFKEPQGIIWIKKKVDVTVVQAIRTQIERMKAEAQPDQRRHSAYIYDQAVRPYVKQIIEKAVQASGFDLSMTDELMEFIKKEHLNKNKVNNGYKIGDQVYEKICIAQYVPYKVKRVPVDDSFSQKKINKIPYSDHVKRPDNTNLTISQRLTEHLNKYEDKKKPFSPEGLERLTQSNKNIPIKKVRITDGKLEEKNQTNVFGNKYLENDSIEYFVIYENIATRERKDMYSLSAYDVIQRKRNGLPIAEYRKGYRTILIQPNDLVYVPTNEEWEKLKEGKPNPINWSDKERICRRIYRMIKSTGKQCYFVPHSVSSLILPYDDYDGRKIGELGSQNSSEYTIDDDNVLIKMRCIKLNVDRLGNIKI